jgi:hypothetical protein
MQHAPIIRFDSDHHLAMPNHCEGQAVLCGQHLRIAFPLTATDQLIAALAAASAGPSKPLTTTLAGHRVAVERHASIIMLAFGPDQVTLHTAAIPAALHAYRTARASYGATGAYLAAGDPAETSPLFATRYDLLFPRPDDLVEEVNQVAFALQYFTFVIGIALSAAAMAAFVLVPMVGQIFAH